MLDQSQRLVNRTKDKAGVEVPDATRHMRYQQATAVGLAFLLLITIGILGSTAGAIIERGDGVSHYLIARWAWYHPALFLDHWGKPLFTLLASPFAQFGMQGVIVFGLVVSMLAVLSGLRVLRTASPLGGLAFVVLLLTAPLYVLMIMAGMTEPLFGVLTVIIVALYHDERHRSAAVIASFLPFARPEFVAFLPFVVLWELLNKRWRNLPFLATGMFVYAVIGQFVIGDPLWYIHNDPYANGPSLYGSGDPWIFVRRLDSITGRPLMVFVVISLVLWPYLRYADRQERRTADLLLVLCALPAMSILALHMVLWGLGIKGSAGILRVAVGAVPMAALFAAYVVPRTLMITGLLKRLNGRTTTLSVAGLLTWSIIDIHGRRMLPIPPNDDEHALREAAAIIGPDLDRGAKLFTTHPFLAICADIDPYDTDRYEMSYGFGGLNARMRPGDLLFWDSELGPNESQIPFDSLWNDPGLEVLACIEPSNGHKVIRHVYYELFMFRRGPAERKAQIDTLVQHEHASEGMVLLMTPTVEGSGTLGGSRIVGLIGTPPTPKNVLLDEYRISMNAALPFNTSKVPIWVYEQWRDGKLIRRRQEELEGGAEVITLRLPYVAGEVSNVFRLDDPGNSGCVITDLRVVRHRWTQRTHPTGSRTDLPN